MKKVILTFLTLLAFNVNAGLITTTSDQVTYNAGDTVLVDLFINEANPSIDWLQVEYLFNNTELSFEGFSITNEVFDNTYYDDIFADVDLLTIQVGFLADWSNFLGTSFQLGQLEFTALSSSVSADFTLADVFAEDKDFNPVSVQAVPEPSAIALFALGLLALRRYRVKG
ncbi:PEP-CTERM sorting domain-containing protein [Colwellia sp. RE-S-Sl-9]